MDGGSEKLREHQYRERKATSLEGKIIEWDGKIMSSTCGSRLNGQWLNVQEKCLAQ